MPGRTKARTRARASPGSVRSVAGRRVGAVSQDDAHGPLGRPRRLLGLEPAGEERRGQVAGHEEHPVELGEGEVGQDGAGLVRQQVAQRRVRSAAGGPPRRCPPRARPRDRSPRPWRRPATRRAGPPRSRRRRRGCPPCPEGRSGRRWPGTARPPGRCRPPWSWRSLAGPGIAAPRRPCGPWSMTGRPRPDAGRPCPCLRSVSPGAPDPALRLSHPLVKQYVDFCLSVNQGQLRLTWPGAMEVSRSTSTASTTALPPIVTASAAVRSRRPPA